MIEQRLRAQGRITRAEVAEMLGLNSPQAYRILKRLADQGVITSVGSGRGAYYEETHGTDK